jgi:glycerol-3-phosphate dehydrogenase
VLVVDPEPRKAESVSELAALDREHALERLASEQFDLVVIGAGIVGARVALEAGRAGGRVALVDAGDLGGATSSASSKLVHGGLRYLARGEIGLVWECHRERRVLLEQVAPHLVRPLSFVLPIYRDGPYRPWQVRAALLTYAALSSFRRSRSELVGPEQAIGLIPSLRAEGLVAAGVYEDAQTDDSRLVLATAQAAARAGVVVVNYLPVTGLELVRGRVVAVRAGDLVIRCRAVVNATGPWVDQVRRMEDPKAAPIARLSKGVHLVVDLPPGWKAALSVPLSGGRVAFAVPWEGVLLLGTTDEEYEGDPGQLRVEAREVEQILREATLGLPTQVANRSRIRYVFAGLRVLPRGAGDTAAARREELIQVGPSGMVSVAGGKLTTHRRIAVSVLRRLSEFQRLRPSSDPLPGAGQPPVRPPEVDQRVWEHLLRHYGTEAAQVARLGLEPIHPDGPDVWGQVWHAVDREWACTVEDVVRRRTTLALRGLATAEVQERVAAIIAERRRVGVRRD